MVRKFTSLNRLISVRVESVFIYEFIIIFLHDLFAKLICLFLCFFFHFILEYPTRLSTRWAQRVCTTSSWIRKRQHEMFATINNGKQPERSTLKLMPNLGDKKNFLSLGMVYRVFSFKARISNRTYLQTSQQQRFRKKYGKYTEMNENRIVKQWVKLKKICSPTYLQIASYNSQGIDCWGSN